MAKLIWDGPGDKIYETGVNHGVLYPAGNDGVYMTGVVWNGLTTVTQSPTGAEATPIYGDNVKYLNLYSAEEFGATIEAYTYPDEFKACNGDAELIKGVTIGQQPRASFGFSYRTILGNDTANDSYGYKIHIIYGAKAAPSEAAFASINDAPAPLTFSWAISTTPIEVAGFKPTASLEIVSTEIEPTKLTKIEDALYGAAEVEARLPLPAEIITLLG